MSLVGCRCWCDAGLSPLFSVGKYCAQRSNLPSVRCLPVYGATLACTDTLLARGYFLSIVLTGARSMLSCLGREYICLRGRFCLFRAPSRFLLNPEAIGLRVGLSYGTRHLGTKRKCNISQKRACFWFSSDISTSMRTCHALRPVCLPRNHITSVCGLRSGCNRVKKYLIAFI